MDSSALLCFDAVSKVYGALRGVTVEVPRGGFTVVMGPSGSGKSTFMNLAAGLDDVTSGEVRVDGHPLHVMDDHHRTVLRRTHIGFVFQSYNLVETLDVRENVLLPFELAGRQLSADERTWVDHLIGVLGLTKRIRHRPGELSGGQQQRVAIARALASRPVVVLADEPTGNLDSRGSREVLGLLRTAAREYGQTIVMVSHDPVAASYAERVLILADGRLVGDHPAMAPQRIAELLIALETGAA
jgi:putative ABC transport system ATP-binding protein